MYQRHSNSGKQGKDLRDNCIRTQGVGNVSLPNIS